MKKQNLNKSTWKPTLDIMLNWCERNEPTPSRGGRKGLRWCGFAIVLGRFCSNFHFNWRYYGFKALSGLWLFQPLHVSRGFRWKKMSAVITLFRTVEYVTSLADVSFHIVACAVSVFGKKSNAVCSFLAYFCAVLLDIISYPCLAGISAECTFQICLSCHSSESEHFQKPLTKDSPMGKLQILVRIKLVQASLNNSSIVKSIWISLFLNFIHWGFEVT